MATASAGAKDGLRRAQLAHAVRAAQGSEAQWRQDDAGARAPRGRRPAGAVGLVARIRPQAGAHPARPVRAGIRDLGRRRRPLRAAADGAQSLTSALALLVTERAIADLQHPAA